MRYHVSLLVSRICKSFCLYHAKDEKERDFLSFVLFLDVFYSQTRNKIGFNYVFNFFCVYSISPLQFSLTFVKDSSLVYKNIELMNSLHYKSTCSYMTCTNLHQFPFWWIKNNCNNGHSRVNQIPKWLFVWHSSKL